MPVLSCFTSFGFLEFSSAPSECEKVYRSLVSSYRDPVTGKPTFDLSIGTHKEAVIFGWANAIAAARVTLRRAAAELRAETAYSMLEQQEKRYGMSPDVDDTVVQRQAALAAKQKAARGPRYEAVWDGLSAILGSSLIAYRPIKVTEAEAYPPTIQESQGIFRRPDAVAKSVRILTAITRVGERMGDEYAVSNQDDSSSLSAPTIGAGQSFTGDGAVLTSAMFYVKKTGTPGGDMVAKVYAHAGTFGTNSIPTGAPLAVSETLEAADLSASYAETTFRFFGKNQIDLTSGTNYVVTIEFTQTSGGGGTFIDVGADSSAPTHPGNMSTLTSGVWTDAPFDFIFRVSTTLKMNVFYENWNRSLVEELIVPGDILCVDPGNLGLVERVTVLASEGSGTTRKFTAAFQKPHSAGCYATDGPMPLWSNTKRHVLVVVTAAASVDPKMVRRINELFKRIMRGPTTWAIVQPTTVGAGTVGPFTIGTTTGSPLGAVPLESITL